MILSYFTGILWMALVVGKILEVSFLWAVVITAVPITVLIVIIYLLFKGE